MSRNALQNNSRTNGHIIQNDWPTAALNQRMTYEILLIASVTLSDKETNGGDMETILVKIDMGTIWRTIPCTCDCQTASTAPQRDINPRIL